MADLIKTTDFMAIFDDIKACVPYLPPTVLAFVGFRKAWSFIKSVVAGA